MSVKCRCSRVARGAVVILTVLMATAGTQARAQTGDTAKTNAINAMKGDLRRLVSAAEVYRAKNKTYPASLSSLEGFKVSPGVAITILEGTGTGWSGS